ncbi:MAG: hypothetical protein PF518_08050 [Spirochaetaceae bacterium]|nr:hypothetical protein [Spirochaetaceae bacterium]
MNQIYVFSSTGTSLQVAREISRSLGDTIYYGTSRNITIPMLK